MKLYPTCNASQLVTELQRMIAEHGDKPVYISDADTGWLMCIGVQHVKADDDAPERLEIAGDYHENDPVGCAFYNTESRHR